MVTESLRQRSRLPCAAALVATTGLLVALNGCGPRERLSGGGGMPGVDSVAVLPFENLSPDPGQEYFADGMHDALIASLGQLSGLKTVVSRDSVIRFKGAKTELREVARELNVAALVTGAVSRSGERVRVTARLINPKTEALVWADSYERPLRDVLSLHNEIVSAIAREVRLPLKPEAAKHFASARRVDSDAYDLYLKGMFQLWKRTPEGFAQGQTLLRDAIARDQADPLPYAAVASAYPVVYHALSGSGFVPFKEGFPPARAAALKALELDERSADAHMALAVIKTYFDWDWDGAEREFRRALQLNPNLADAHLHYGWYLNIFGRNDEALAALKKAVELDPLTPDKLANVGWLCWNLGRLDEASAWAGRALERDPNLVSGLFVTSGVYADKKMFDEAIAVDKKLAAVAPNWKFSLAGSYILAGRKPEALKIVAEMERENYPGLANWLFMLRTLLGEKEEAFRALDAAFEYHHILLPWTMGLGDAGFPWRTDPRWQQRMRQMNFPKR